MSIYGENLKLSIFGQSHSAYIGMSLEGIPAGLELDFNELQSFLSRRAPGKTELSSRRNEEDIPEFIAGIKDGFSCGNAITAIIKNTDCRPADYENLKYSPRPGHADYTAGIKYGGFQDYSGGGQFSGRMTAPLCIAGGICIQILEKMGIKIISRILSIGDIEDTGQLDEAVCNKAFPVMDDEKGEKMQSLIKELKAKGDSVGGVIECAVLNPPAGLGGPLFEGMESRISALAFGIPGVKGIDFGAGIDSAKMLGSENNDRFIFKDGKDQTLSNNCGGILGGITNAMPLSFRLYIKPTPSIGLPQKTLDLKTMEEKELIIKGRHDPCIVPRILPSAESAAAIALYDAWLTKMREMRP